MSNVVEERSAVFQAACVGSKTRSAGGVTYHIIGGYLTMYEDKTLVCKDCGAEFVFTAGEQEFYGILEYFCAITS